ncbi:MAG: alginate lyase family protein, partial [Xanthomonadales bacterium]|nr:alginate lyase family protein [Xanthomonadales bacterium]
PHPNMFLSQAEIDAIKVKVNLGEDPWLEAYDKVIERADNILDSVDLQSVTYQGIVFGSIQWHQDDDHPAAIIMSDSVRTLGIAYAFTGDSRYADRAIEFIWTWALDPVTRMRPTPPGKRIQIYVTMPALFYGADLIGSYEGWDPAEKAAFEGWVQTIGNYVRDNGDGLNNFSNWRTVMLASAGAFLDDDVLLDKAETLWKDLIPFQIINSNSENAGLMDQEYTRDDGLHYSLFAINAMIQTAEIMHTRGVNLYDYVHVFDGGATAGLKLALDFITPYAIDPQSWRDDGYSQDGTIAQRHHMAIYEMAYSYYQEQQFLDAINRWVRPMYENRIMGITTLTHGNTFTLSFDPVPPSITNQPAPQSAEEGASVTFNITASGSATLRYQWFLGDDEIPGATGSSYTIAQVSPANNGELYRCRVRNDLGEVFSSYAELTVVADTTAPLIAAAIVQSLEQVDVIFTEGVTTASAQAAANYQISGAIQVLNAALNADNKTVHLQTDPLEPDTTYTLTVSDIQDRSAATNTILAGSSVDIVFSPVMNFDNGQLPFSWTPLTASRWSVVMEGGNNALFLNDTEYSPLPTGRLGEHITSPDSYTDFTFSVKAKTKEPSGNLNADYALVFAYQDGENYYYMLFNRIQTNTQLFKVVAGERELLKTATTGRITDNNYHTVAVRRVADSIEISFDNSVVLEVTDSTFLSGKLGLGSFNDAAYFDDIRISGGSGVLNDLIFSGSFE